MSAQYEEYLKFFENPVNHFTTKRHQIDKKDLKIKIFGPNDNFIYLKDSIYLNYGVTDDISIIYIEDISAHKQFTTDFNYKNFKLHLAHNMLYIDFNTEYYYVLLEFDTFAQFEYCQKNKKLTIAILNDNKSDIINKKIADVNFL